MNKKIVFIADFFSEDIIGGGELNNEELIKLLNLQYEVIKIRSHDVSEIFVESNKDCFFIVANFVNLSQSAKNSLLTKKYIIYEHDHKYINTRNPSVFKNFLCNESNLINKDFYKKAIAIFAQSKIHSEVIYKNLQIKNIINCSGNLWSDEQIQVLKKYKDSNKKYDCGILESKNSIKNTFDSVEYCKNNNLNYTLIPFTNFENYIQKLSECKKFIFFPKVLETLSRTSIEAKILNCKLLTNNLLGVASEDWIKEDSDKILQYIIDNKQEIVKKVISCIEENNYQEYFYKFNSLPKISIITSIYKAEKYINNFLKNITKQTIFEECELILINANSDQDEEKYIFPFLEKHKNIKYIKLDNDPGLYGVWNIGINQSTGEYICNSNVDDLRHIDNLEILRKHLFYSEEVDLVYGDSCVVNEIPESNKKYDMILSEHSIFEFSQENMIKCLPGALPLWKKTMHQKCGMFQEKYKSAGDWEMWLRAVENGSKFKKVDIISGYYYNNPTGLSTNKDSAKSKFNEEKEVFFKYKNVFGKNYNKYLNWFSRENI